MLRLSLRSLVAAKTRLLLTAVAIVAGTAFLCATLTLTASFNATVDRVFGDASHGIAVDIRGALLPGQSNRGGTTGRQPLQESLLTTVQQAAGVAAVAGEILRPVALLGKDGQPQTGLLPSLGFAWIDAADLNLYPLSSGSSPHGADQAVIDVGTAHRLKVGIGDRIAVSINGGPAQQFRLVGLCGFGSAVDLGGTTLVGWDLPTAQHLFGLEGKLDVIAVAASAGTPDVQLRDRLAALLPASAEAVTGGDASKETLQELQQRTAFLGEVLLGFALIALFVSSFIIANTFAMLISQRTRELALLRLVGATRRQVVSLVLGEAALLGLMASGIGVLAGEGLAKAVFTLLNNGGIDLPPESLVFSWRTALAGVIVGSAVTVAAAVIPTRRATGIAPVVALREALTDLESPSAFRLVAGVLGLLAAVTLMALGVFGPSANRLSEVGGGSALFFVSLAIVAPVVLPSLVQVLSWPGARWRGVAGRLARENALRNPRRTAATAIALMIGVTLIACATVLGYSLEQSIRTAVLAGQRSTFLVVPVGGGPFTTSAANALKRDPNLTDIGEVAIARVVVSGHGYTVGAIDPAIAQLVVNFTAVEGRYSDFATGTVLVDATTATQNHLNVGDEVSVTFPDRSTQPQRIVAIYTDNRLIGSYVLSLPTLKQHDPAAQDVVILVNNASGVSTDQARASLDRDLSPFPTLKAYTQDEFIAQRSQQIESALVLVTGLLLIAVLIAIIGMVNTLALSILERTREIGLLRALGLERRQVRVMVRWEAIAIALLSALVGVAAGIGVAWMIVQSLASQGFGDFAIPWAQLGLLGILALAAAVAAAVVPARRAANINIIAAIAVE